MTDAAEAARAPTGPTAAWARSSDLRFYATSSFLALDLVLVVLMLRAREEPVIPPDRPRPSQRVYELGAPREPTRPAPNTPDPQTAPFTLDLALAGLPGTGALTATVETSRGTLRCTLDTARAPLGVATFVGLARGTRPYWDGVAGRWSRAPFYDGSVIFRVVPGARIEGGGPTRSALVQPGFAVPRELSRPHDRAGLLSLTPRGTLQVLAGPDPSLDGQDALIGRCEPAGLVDLLTDTRANAERPVVPLFLRAVRITRS
ncbi:MAG: peptidylprolyl isomerase [Polyangiales bacterium]